MRHTRAAHPRAIRIFTPLRRTATFASTRMTTNARVVVHRLQPRRFVTLVAAMPAILMLSPPARLQLVRLTHDTKHIRIIV